MDLYERHGVNHVSWDLDGIRGLKGLKSAQSSPLEVLLRIVLERGDELESYQYCFKSDQGSCGVGLMRPEFDESEPNFIQQGIPLHTDVVSALYSALVYGGWSLPESLPPCQLLFFYCKA